MDDHAGRVQHAAQARCARGDELSLEPRSEVARIDAGADLLARPVENGAGSVDRKRVVGAAGKLVHRGKVAQLHAEKGYCASAFSTSCGSPAHRRS